MAATMTGENMPLTVVTLSTGGIGAGAAAMLRVPTVAAAYTPRGYAGAQAAKTTLSTVDDFAVQAQARLNAVKAEFGNVEAFNMVTPKPVSLSRLNAPTTKPFADPGKLARHGEFDWNKYTPIIVEERNGILTIQDGMTRFENARRAGITELPAYVFPSR